MKYKNTLNIIMNFKVNKKWITVQPGKEIELTNPHITIEGLEKVLEKPKAELKPKPEQKEPKEPEGKKELSKVTKADLEKLTQDQLNDRAAIMGYGRMTVRWKKADMVKKILELQSK